MSKLILASSSIYRKSLLDRLGVDFSVISPGIDESAYPEETPAQLVKRLAEAKARAVMNDSPQSLIIGSDQVAVCNGNIFGKPINVDTAIKQLTLCSGQRVEFITGLALLNTESGHVQIETIPYYVTFRKLTQSQIEHYLDQEQPFHCTCAFKSEGLGVALVECFEGSDSTALIGLPLIRLIRMLKKEGVDLLDDRNRD